MAINFDTVVESILQRPLVSGMPLYLRVDGGVDMSGQNKTVNNAWVQESKKRCTSPDNIRRVFITCTGVKKHLFLSVGKDGLLEHTGNYDDSLIKTINERKALIAQRVSASDMLKIRTTNEKNKVVQKFEQINGYGFGALQKAHVYQNVEEVYIDKALMLGLSTKTNVDFQWYLKQMKPDEALKQAFICENASNITEVTNRFKRLNTLAFVENLDTAYDMMKRAVPSTRSYDNWLQTILKVSGGKETLGNVIVAKMQEGNKWREQWSVKDGLYVFDRDKLAPYVEKDLYKLRNESKIKEEERLKNEPKHSIEELLDLLYIRGNLEDVKANLIYLLKTKEVSLRDIDSFSTTGKKRYGKMFRDIADKVKNN